MELEDAIHTAMLTLKEGFEGEVRGAVVGAQLAYAFTCGCPCVQMTSKNIEMAKVGDDGKFHRFTEEEIQDYLDEAE